MTSTYLQKILNKARQKYRVPAVAVVIMNSDSVLFQEIQGTRVAGTDNPVTWGDYFHIGSCSKSVLAVMAAKLIEQKKITWQTKFFEVFPELKDAANGAYRDITLEDLFLGEAGIKAYTDMDTEPFPEYGPSIGDKRLEFIKHLIAQPPSSKKKDGRFQHFYSNAGYTMASAMLERVSGDTYEKLVKKTLTDGLGMSVHIGWPNSIGPDQPWGHLVTKNKNKLRINSKPFRLITNTNSLT